MDALTQHRSIRKYKSDPIPESDLAAILHASTRGSSSGNMQTYSIIVTHDPDRRRALWEMHFEQDMILQAPVLLTYCVDWRRMSTWCRLSDCDPGFDNLLCFMVGFADAVIAAQNAALAAECRGYGICYMGTTLCATPQLIDFFDLPPGVFPVTTLVVGRPDENPDLRARLPIDGIVHHEQYECHADERIKAIYHDRETEGWNRYMQFPDLAEMMRESGVKNLAQVYTQLKYTREANERISGDLRRMLERQGFVRNHEDTPDS